MLSEKFKFRVLCWIARRLGFDLVEFAPEDLRPPVPVPKPKEEVLWYVERRWMGKTWCMVQKSNGQTFDEVIGPFRYADAEQVMLLKNGLERKDPKEAARKQREWSEKLKAQMAMKTRK